MKRRPYETTGKVWINLRYASATYSLGVRVIMTLLGWMLLHSRAGTPLLDDISPATVKRGSTKEIFFTHNNTDGM